MVAEDDATVDDLLLAEAHQPVRPLEYLPLDAHRDAERVARTARLLVLRSRPEAQLPPVQRIRQVVVKRRAILRIRLLALEVAAERRADLRLSLALDVRMVKCLEHHTRFQSNVLFEVLFRRQVGHRVSAQFERVVAALGFLIVRPNQPHILLVRLTTARLVKLVLVRLVH